MKQNLYHTSKITLFYLKRNKWKMFFWLAGLVLLTLIIPPAFKNIYPDNKELIPVFEMFKSPAMEAMLGKAHLSQANLATMFAYEMQLFTIILVAIMNILFVAKDTRGEEEDGRLEMMSALPIGRDAVLTSAVIQQVIVNSVLVLAIGIGLSLINIPHFTVEGSFLYGASLAASGLLFGMLTLVVAQLSATRSQTVGISISLLLIMYLLRAIGDVSAEGLSNWMPLGWIPHTEVYSNNHWWPIITLIASSAVLLIIAFILNSRRDAEAGLLPTFSGHAEAGWLLKSTLGMQFRLQRTGLIAWGIGMFVLGLSYGSVFGDLDAFFKNNPMLKRMLTGDGTNYAEQFVPILMAIMGMVATIPVLMAIFKIRKEMSFHREELILSHPVSRIRYLMSFVWIGLLNSVMMIIFAALGMYAGEASSMKNPIAFEKIIIAGAVYIPAILVFAGLAVMVVGWLEKMSILVYLYLAYCFLVVYLGQLLDVKKWLKEMTPFGHVPRLPVADMNWPPLLWMLLIFIICMVVGIIGFRRRDI
ncbi:ABC transporter permease [Staphylococcus condimenti]|uniref:ABC transporter permease n=2 Tax=Staphylococcus condimenti TaxID=70255 RepID=A0AB37H1C4_9STAP|nr:MULTISPECIES: ABC transporter permease subunit [Staphylococcus]AMY06167.1 ABC transporter permease [Staphylococcus condimenti]APR60046.1 ABC transporter permease [Staphylococcus condimenti]OFO99478.1 ABC transporter permease [Staphylococcus sp. HMSC065E08]PNZ63824.1 ABC transporter permease [Staphylococcus condimenti]QQS82034.1 ABC transporter permease [Staphylococcus condimenti]